MVTALPYQGKLMTPIQWQGSTAKITMGVGSYTLSGTVGWKPYKEVTNLEWKLTEAESADLIDQFSNTNWNGVYGYTCNQRGAIKIRLTGNYSIQEVTDAGDWIKYVTLSAGVETV